MLKLTNITCKYVHLFFKIENQKSEKCIYHFLSGITIHIYSNIKEISEYRNIIGYLQNKTLLTVQIDLIVIGDSQATDNNDIGLWTISLNNALSKLGSNDLAQ